MIPEPPPSVINSNNPLQSTSVKYYNGVRVETIFPSTSPVTPLKSISGLNYKTPLIDCNKIPLLSLDKLPCPIQLPKPPPLSLPNKQEFIDRGTKFIKDATALPPIPGLGSPSLPSKSNLPKLDIKKLASVPCADKVPTLSALNPFPAYQAQISAWLKEPVTFPDVGDLLKVLPQLPKPPYFTIPCLGDIANVAAEAGLAASGVGGVGALASNPLSSVSNQLPSSVGGTGV
jgi:hypothetical protein